MLVVLARKFKFSNFWLWIYVDLAQRNFFGKVNVLSFPAWIAEKMSFSLFPAFSKCFLKML